MPALVFEDLSRDDRALVLRALLPAFIDTHFAAAADELDDVHEHLSDAFSDVRLGDIPSQLQNAWARSFGDDRVSIDVSNLYVWSSVSRTQPIELKLLTGTQPRFAVDPAEYGRASLAPPPKMGIDKQGTGKGGVRIEFCPQI